MLFNHYDLEMIVAQQIVNNFISLDCLFFSNVFFQWFFIVIFIVMANRNSDRESLGAPSSRLLPL